MKKIIAIVGMLGLELAGVSAVVAMASQIAPALDEAAKLGDDGVFSGVQKSKEQAPVVEVQKKGAAHKKTVAKRSNETEQQRSSNNEKHDQGVMTSAQRDEWLKTARGKEWLKKHPDRK